MQQLRRSAPVVLWVSGASAWLGGGGGVRGGGGYVSGSSLHVIVRQDSLSSFTSRGRKSRCQVGYVIKYQRTGYFFPSLISLMVSVDVKHHVYFAQAILLVRANIFLSSVICSSQAVKKMVKKGVGGGGGGGGRKGKKKKKEKRSESELRRCVKVGAVVLASQFLLVLMVFVDVKQHLKKE